MLHEAECGSEHQGHIEGRHASHRSRQPATDNKFWV